MGLESPTFISDFITTNPDQEDLRRQGDDHLRNMKAAIVATFPNIDGPVLATPDELNLLVGLTSLPEVAIVSINLDFSTALAAGSSRTFAVASIGILPSDTILPVPGSAWSSYPGLIVTSWLPGTDQITVVVINAGSTEIPISTLLALPFAVLN